MTAPVAVITGAARGIGAARRVAATAGGSSSSIAGDDAALTSPLATPEELDAVAAETAGVATVGDVRDQGALDHAIALALERFDGLDAAVAVAGCVGEAGCVGDAGGDLGGHGRREPRGRVASSPGGGPGAASSAGTAPGPVRRCLVRHRHQRSSPAVRLLGGRARAIGFVRSLAAELGPLGVTANIVTPGSTATSILDASAAVYGLTDASEFAKHHQLDRLVTPDEVAALVAWICSPASSGVTGAVLAVDGGMTAS